MSKLVLMLLATLMLAGCGNKGPLYLPEQALPTDTVSSSAEH